MKDLKHSVVATMLLVLVGGLVLAGCSEATVPELRIGWIGTNNADEMVYRYMTFRGTEEGTVHVEAGETVVLAYAADVTKGTLTFQVQSPSDETLWETTLTESVNEQQVELALSEAGTCQILAIGKETGGSFALSWGVR
jgi:hypothetical protein